MSRITNPRLIGITLGEPAGIGPEIILKAFQRGLFKSSRFVILADEYSLKYAVQLSHSRIKINRITRPFSSTYVPGALNYIACESRIKPSRYKPGFPNDYSSSLAYEAIVTGVRLCMDNEISALVTNPVSKEHIVRTGKRSFTGHTGLISKRSHVKEDADMVFGCDKGVVGLVTTHVSLKTAARMITKHAIIRLVARMAVLMAQLYGTKPVFAVMGLNPHAGEGGTMGTEESAVILPAIRSCRKIGLKIEGPFPSDSFWRNHFQKGGFNAMVAMYHDQGLIPVKSGLLGKSVNISLGLPFIRTSPDHGTALDIAGKGLADPSGLGMAFQTALRLSKG
jgi:4-phospho-D-threonate 3-dehydrogenase / 4-phospho-D-erythronate 3-dehydrogenase